MMNIINVVKTIYNEFWGLKIEEHVSSSAAKPVSFSLSADSLLLAYNRDVGVNYAAAWEMPPLEHFELCRKRDICLFERALELSKCRVIWNLNEEPPIDFSFNVHHSMPYAAKSLEQDEHLRLAFAEFVPYKMTEFFFWRRYFWHLELMKCEVTDEFQMLSTKEQMAMESSMIPENLRLKPEILYLTNRKYHSFSRGAVLRVHQRNKLQKVANQSKLFELNAPKSRRKSKKRVTFDSISTYQDKQCESTMSEHLNRAFVVVSY